MVTDKLYTSNKLNTNIHQLSFFSEKEKLFSLINKLEPKTKKSTVIHHFSECETLKVKYSKPLFKNVWVNKRKFKGGFIFQIKGKILLNIRTFDAFFFENIEKAIKEGLCQVNCIVYKAKTQENLMEKVSLEVKEKKVQVTTINKVGLSLKGLVSIDNEAFQKQAVGSGSLFYKAFIKKANAFTIKTLSFGNALRTPLFFKIENGKASKKKPPVTFFYVGYRPKADDIGSQILCLNTLVGDNTLAQKTQDFLFLCLLFSSITFSTITKKINISQKEKWSPFWLDLMNSWISMPYDPFVLDLNALSTRLKENLSVKLIYSLHLDVLKEINKKRESLKITPYINY